MLGKCSNTELYTQPQVIIFLIPVGFLIVERLKKLTALTTPGSVLIRTALRDLRFEVFLGETPSDPGCWFLRRLQNVSS